MVFAKEDTDGKVIAWAEIRLVDEIGNEDPKGIYVWIHEVWVHETLRTRNRFNDLLKGFILEGKRRFPQAIAIYWQRDKHEKKMSLYSREKILRRTNDGWRKEGTRLYSTTSAGATADTAAV